MTNTLANSQQELNQVKGLLNKKIPSYRQAYSDRTAWLMACLSELAYIKFNPLFSGQQQKALFLESISKLVGENSKSSLIKLIASVGYDHDEEEKKLKNELETLNITLLETFDSNGTQAILVANDTFIALAFRGTEATSIKDIKSDAKAKPLNVKQAGKSIQDSRRLLMRWL